MEANLRVQNRQSFGKGSARSLRRAGMIPAVAYAGGKEPIHLALDPKELMKILNKYGANTVLHFEFEDESFPRQTAMLKKLQRHPVYRRPMHADFMLIDITKPIKITVGLEFVGRSIGAIKGGTIDIIRRKLDVECLPSNIPDHITVDITNLDVGGNLHVKDIQLPEGVTCLDDERYAIITCSGLSDDDVKSEEDEEEMAAE